MFLYLGILAILTCLYHFVLGVKGWFVPAAVMAIPAFLIYGFIKLKINPNEAEKVRKYVERKKTSHIKLFSEDLFSDDPLTEVDIDPFYIATFGDPFEDD